MLLDRTRVKRWQKLVFGFMVVVMAGFLVMIPLAGNLACGATTAEEQLAAEIAKFEADLVASPDDVDVLLGLGETYVSRAIQQAPRSSEQRADWALALEQYETAIAILAEQEGAEAEEQQIDVLKQVVDVHLVAAQVLGVDPDLQAASLREFGEASDVYVRITAIQPEEASLYFDWASIAINADDINTALLAFSKFVELDPDSPDAPAVKQWIKDNSPKSTPSPSSTEATDP